MSSYFNAVSCERFARFNLNPTLHIKYITKCLNVIIHYNNNNLKIEYIKVWRK